MTNAWRYPRESFRDWVQQHDFSDFQNERHSEQNRDIRIKVLPLSRRNVYKETQKKNICVVVVPWQFINISFLICFRIEFNCRNYDITAHFEISRLCSLKTVCQCIIYTIHFKFEFPAFESTKIARKISAPWKPLILPRFILNLWNYGIIDNFSNILPWLVEISLRYYNCFWLKNMFKRMKSFSQHIS